jgi:hypothetical protein
MAGSILASEAAYHVTKSVTKNEAAANVASFAAGMLPFLGNPVNLARGAVNAVKSLGRGIARFFRPPAPGAPPAVTASAVRAMTPAVSTATKTAPPFVGDKLLGAIGRIGASAQVAVGKIAGVLRPVGVEAKFTTPKIVEVGQRAASTSVTTSAVKSVGAKAVDVFRRVVNAVKAPVKGAVKLVGSAAKSAAKFAVRHPVATLGLGIGGAIGLAYLKHRGEKARMDSISAQNNPPSVNQAQRASQNVPTSQNVAQTLSDIAVGAAATVDDVGAVLAGTKPLPSPAQIGAGIAGAISGIIMPLFAPLLMIMIIPLLFRLFKELRP